jgi:hypothetical protein
MRFDLISSLAIVEYLCAHPDRRKLNIRGAMSQKEIEGKV